MTIRLEEKVIQQFQQVCKTNPDLDLDDIFELEDSFFPRELYSHIYELRDFWAQEEMWLRQKYLEDAAEKNRLHHQGKVYLLYFGLREKRLSSEFSCIKREETHYFSVEIHSDVELEPLRELSRQNKLVQLDEDGNQVNITLNAKMPAATELPNYYLLAIDQDQFSVLKVDLPKRGFSYPYYVARQLCNMFTITSLGDQVREDLAFYKIPIPKEEQPNQKLL